MALFVNTNVSGLNGQRNLQNVTDRMNSSFEKLSSGSRINSARDDSAGLQISDRLSTQITGLQQGNRNANDGISIAQIAEGALGEITTNIQRVRQLVVQGGNRTLSSDDRDALGQEFQKLLNTNNNIADRTAFGTIKLLDNSTSSAGFQIQSGAQAGEQDTITTGNAKLTAMLGKLADSESVGSMTLSNISTTVESAGTVGKLIGAYMAGNNVSDIATAADALFGSTRSGAMSELGVSVTSITLSVSALSTALTGAVSTSATLTSNMADMASALGATATIGTLSGIWEDDQINVVYGKTTDALLTAMSGLVSEVDKQRAKLGAEQNGLSSTIRSNAASIVNVSDARSRITDTDFATETAELTRNQIIQQAATTILSQANQLPQTALSLLR